MNHFIEIILFILIIVLVIMIWFIFLRDFFRDKNENDDYDDTFWFFHI